MGGQSTTRQNLGDDIWCIVEYQTLFLGRLHSAHNDYCKMTRPGVYEWRDWSVGVERPVAGGIEVELPAPSPETPLIVRSAQSGDVFLGRAGRRKLSRLLIDQKVPRRLRKEVLMIEFKGILVWGAGFGRSRVSSPQRDGLTRVWIKPSRDFDLGS
jgi:tRNA(Ile)-lysidine synthetase-like protein